MNVDSSFIGFLPLYTRMAYGFLLYKQVKIYVNLFIYISLSYFFQPTKLTGAIMIQTEKNNSTIYRFKGIYGLSRDTLLINCKQPGSSVFKFQNNLEESYSISI